MQMRACGGASALAYDGYRVTRIHDVALLMKQCSVVFIDRNDILIMLNTNGIASLGTPVGEHHCAVPHRFDDLVGISHYINAIMLVIVVKPAGNHTVKRGDEHWHLVHIYINRYVAVVDILVVDDMFEVAQVDVVLVQYTFQ